MGTGSSLVLVRRGSRRGSAFVLLAALGYVSGVSCAGRSESRGERGNVGGSSTGGVTGGVGGATGGVGAGATGGAMMGKAGSIVIPEGGGAGNVPGNGGKGASGGNGASGGVSGQSGSGGDAPFHCVERSVSSLASPNLVQCEGGFAHRPTAAACPPLEEAQAGAGGEGGIGGEECPRQCAPDETCIWTIPNEFHPFSECARVCETDAQCPSGSICACVPGLFLRPSDDGPGTTVGMCRTSNCTVDADCPPGLLCIAPLSADFCEPVPRTFHCQTPADECAGPEHCESDSCMYRDDRFVCDDEGC
jgi:hypothetical protein